SQNCTTQFEWFKAELAKVPASDWLIVVGHHPADEMDVEDFVAPMVQHGFDLYLNGHTHLLNHYTINGGGAYVTSGAGAMVRTKDQDDEESHLVTGKGSKKVQLVWEEKVAGFTLHTFSSDFKDLKTDYISYTGDILHSFNVTRGSGSTQIAALTIRSLVLGHPEAHARSLAVAGSTPSRAASATLTARSTKIVAQTITPLAGALRRSSELGSVT
ncbi:DIP13, partial [Symbiodinium necroappetens]